MERAAFRFAHEKPEPWPWLLKCRDGCCTRSASTTDPPTIDFRAWQVNFECKMSGAAIQHRRAGGAFPFRTATYQLQIPRWRPILSVTPSVRSPGPSNPVRKCVNATCKPAMLTEPAAPVTGHRRAFRRADHVRARRLRRHHPHGCRGARHRALEPLRLRWADRPKSLPPQPANRSKPKSILLFFERVCALGM